MSKYDKIVRIIKDADAILVGASNGFSISEGLHLFAANDDFNALFGDFKRKYGINNILQGCFANYPSEEEMWIFYSRLANHYSINYHGSDKTEALKNIIGNKPYFMVTSNGENHFELAGFDKNCIYEAEGSWKEMQCEKPCHSTLYPAFKVLKSIAAAEQDGKISSTLIPKCPKCGGSMKMHIVGGGFIPDTAAQKRFSDFISRWHNKKLVVLELGIGWRNQMIKAPFMNLVAQEPNSRYITINKGEIYIIDAIKEKSFGLDGDMGEILSELSRAML